MQKNIGGVKFWLNAVDEANGEEYFGESDSSFTVFMNIGCKNFGKLFIIHQIPQNFLHPIFSLHVNTNYVCFAGILIVS